MDYLTLEPVYNDNKYYYKIIHRGNTLFLLLLNDKQIELNEDFLKIYKDNFNHPLSFYCCVTNNTFQARNYDNNIYFNLCVTLKKNLKKEHEIDFSLSYGKYNYCTKFILNAEEIKETNKGNYGKTTHGNSPYGNSAHGNSTSNEINEIYNSTIGLRNIGGSCSIASVIQILAHTRCFLNEFLKNYKHNHNSNSISTLFYNLLMSFKNKNETSEFYDFCMRIKSQTGNNPMYFCCKFLDKLNKENPGIIDLFSGIKKVIFENQHYDNDRESFLFQLVYLSYDEQLKDILFNKPNLVKIGNKCYNQIENLIEGPKILMINIETEKMKGYYFSFEIPKNLKIGNFTYKLYAFNKYDDNHSKA